jgi:hypothetical protein
MLHDRSRLLDDDGVVPDGVRVSARGTIRHQYRRECRKLTRSGTAGPATAGIGDLASPVKFSSTASRARSTRAEKAVAHLSMK